MIKTQLNKFTMAKAISNANISAASGQVNLPDDIAGTS